MSSLLIAKNYFYLAEYALKNKFGYLRMKKPEYLIGKPQENTKRNSNIRYLLDLLYLSDIQDYFEMSVIAGSQRDACH